jgi:DNA adenine methylase
MIENLPWQECVKRYDRAHTFFYADPPYWETEGYGVPFPFEEYQVLASAMRTCKGKMMVSINDHPQIREAFDGLVMHDLEITYTVGVEREGRKASKELVITNWNPEVMGQLF